MQPARRWLGAALLLLAGCSSLPDGVRPVHGFDLQRYLGTWYEVARLDHSFERGLEQVTARYTLRSDGGVAVLNRGYDAQSDEWREAAGRASFVDQPSVGHLKVSFFGPFYASYIVFGLDHANYQYAFVSGPSTSYLWLLSRTPSVEEAVLEEFLREAGRLGFDTSSLIYPRQK